MGEREADAAKAYARGYKHAARYVGGDPVGGGVSDAPERTPRWIGVPEEKYEELKAKVVALEQEQVRLIAELDTGKDILVQTTEELAERDAEVAALEQDRDELRKLLFVDRDEWRRIRVHGDTVLALEAKHAEVERLRAEIREIAHDIGAKVGSWHNWAKRLRALTSPEGGMMLTTIQVNARPDSRFILATGDPDSGLLIKVNASVGPDGVAVVEWPHDEPVRMFVRVRHPETQTYEGFVQFDGNMIDYSAGVPVVYPRTVALTKPEGE